MSFLNSAASEENLARYRSTVLTATTSDSPVRVSAHAQQKTSLYSFMYFILWDQVLLIYSWLIWLWKYMSGQSLDFLYETSIKTAFYSLYYFPSGWSCESALATSISSSVSMLSLPEVREEWTNISRVEWVWTCIPKHDHWVLLNYPWSINNIKEGGCCGSLLLSILSGPHPYKISSMTFHMWCPSPSI